MSYKIISFFLIGFGCALALLYTSFLRKAPVHEILAANQLLSDHSNLLNEFMPSSDLWDAWIEEMKFVSIGKIFDSCDLKKRITIGRVVMMQDEEGGVMSRTFVNVTLTRDITSGSMQVSCEYSGRVLYTNKWDLCGMEGDEGVHRSFVCPISMGRKRFVKQMKIPNYLPKGSYKVDVKVEDQNGQVIGCGYAAFTL